MKKIVVLGAGHGGIIAAIKLASQGYDVTIFEQNDRGNVSYDWEDVIRFNIFSFLKIEPPPKEVYSQRLKWRFISPDEKNSFKVPKPPRSKKITISRRGLIEHLISLAESAGAKFIFNKKVVSLKFDNNMVSGIITENGEEYSCDLAIDASGLRSPFRGQLHSSFLVQSQPGKDDLLQACRVFFKPSEAVTKPEPNNSLVVMHQDYPGLSWCNHNHLNEIDVLVGRVGSLSKEEAKNAIEDLRSSHSILSNIKLRPPTFAEIGIRAPLAVPVADGYAAVGDSAFQFMPLTGSGIEASMKAGLFLATTVLAAGDNQLTAPFLWPYQVRFMKNIGASYMFIDVLKRLALTMPLEQVNSLFELGATTEKDLSFVFSDRNADEKSGSTSMAQRAKVLSESPRLIGLSTGYIFKASLAKSTASKIPKKYDIQKIAKWKEKYDECIDPKYLFNS